MANFSKTKGPFAFTSPRSILKIIPEIELLVNRFAGQKWNEDTQIEFFGLLFDSVFYEGETFPDDPAFAARDRITRAPKALGFVDLAPTIQLTKAGRFLLSRRRPHETIARQLFKFQLPSPYHKIPVDRGFNVRPYLEILRLIDSLERLSKIEIGLFFGNMNTYKKFDLIVEKIHEFRKKENRVGQNYKEYIDKVFTDEICNIYSEEVEKRNFHTRESDDRTFTKWVNTKKQNHMDYADAFLRYLRATELISFQKRGFIATINPFFQDYVTQILEWTEREAKPFKSEQHYKEYLFEPYSLRMPFDERETLETKLKGLNVQVEPEIQIEKLKDLFESVESEIRSTNVAIIENTLKDYSEFEDIIDTYVYIKKTPDPSLYLEWNTWRAITMLNYATDITGNFSVDVNGDPLMTAPGNLPDIEIEYKDFKLVVEVTLSSGHKQYEMEGESIARHLGKVRSSTSLPVYGLFIAPKISEGTLAHIFNLNRMNTKAYGGKTAFIPMSVDQFIRFIYFAKEKSFSDPLMIKSYFDTLLDLNQNPHITENIWFNSVGLNIEGWCSLP